MWWTAGRRAWAAVALVAVLAACGSGGDDPGASAGPSTRPFSARSVKVGPYTALGDSTRAAGSVVIDGLRVPAGSDLLGTTFPDLDGKGGFLALGLVTGDPVAVFNGYLDQAGGMGMALTNGGGCLPSQGSVICTRTVTDPDDGESLTVRVERRGAPPGFISHVALRYQPPGSIDAGGLGPPKPTPPTQPITAVTLPASVPEPSDQGWNSSVAPAGPGLRLVAGSLLVAPPGPCGCSGAGWSAVLRVTGDVDQVLAAYTAQLTDTPVTPKASIADGARLQQVDLGITPAGFAQFRTISRGGDTYLLIAVAKI